MSTTVETRSRAEDRFVAAYERLAGHTLNGSNAHVQGLRQQAIERFKALGFPAPRSEAYKYTNISRALRHPYVVRLAPEVPSVEASTVDALRIPDLDAVVLVLVDGRLNTELSDLDALPEGVVVTSLAHAAEEHADLVNQHLGAYADGEEPFVALNTAFIYDGLFVYVPEGTVVERPLHLINLLSADEELFIQPRHLFVAEAGAQVRIVETGATQTEEKTFTNAVTEVFVGRRANVDHVKLQDDGADASQVHTVHVYQEGDSFFSTNTVTLSGALVRNNLTFLPNAEHCETHLFGLFVAQDETHVDSHTLVDHAKPNCFSNELYKGILSENATGVFNGKVFVRPDAQQTNAYQSNKSILLDETATMYSKPELEIYADDVKCSHGATTGQLDAEALFYLRSRGLTERQARMLMLQAFARDVLDVIRLEPVRAYLDALVADRLSR